MHVGGKVSSDACGKVSHDPLPLGINAQQGNLPPQVPGPRMGVVGSRRLVGTPQQAGYARQTRQTRRGF